MTRRWYDFRAQARGAEIVIYDEIGAFGIPAKAFLDELRALRPVAELTVRINSLGGSVFDGVAIYNALKRHDARVTVWVDGIAASIASMIAMAGDEVVMPENAMLMLHDPSGLVAGTAADMRAMAEALDRMKAGMVAAYRDKSGRDDAEIEALMTAETWLSAQEAVALGLVDRVDEPVRMAARFEAAAGILYDAVDASTADAEGVAIVRLAEVNAAELVWPAGITGPEQTTALGELAALSIIAR